MSDLCYTPSDTARRAYAEDLLRSHGALPPEQLAPLLSSLSGELARSDAQISVLRERMDAALSDRAALQRLYDGCLALSAPIRRLPSEMLGEIFGWCIDDANDGNLNDCRTGLTRICARWRMIVLGIPPLWGRIYVDLTDTSLSIGSLGSALDYGRNTPLTLVVRADSRPPNSSAIQLLASHSTRWKCLTYFGPSGHLETFAGVTGKMPTLETANMHDWGFDTDNNVSIFRTAPRLKSITAGAVSQVLLPPLEQLVFLKRTTVDPSDLATETLRASALSDKSSFDLQFYLDNQGRSSTVHLNLTPTTLPVSRLRIEIESEFHRDHCRQAFSQIFDNLTLPHLEELELSSTEFIRFPLIWPHARAIALFNRSAFSAHLRVLNITDVDISELQLRECLAALSSLEQLAIADHLRIRGRGANVILITDSLLRALSRSSSSFSAVEVIVPRLNTFRIRSRMQFHTDVYLEFLLSRARMGEGRRFTIGIQRHPEDSAARMDPVLYTRLRELQAEKRVILDRVSPPHVNSET